MARLGDQPPQQPPQPRGVTQMTPTPDQIVPVQSASEYAARTEAKRKDLAGAKGSARPLGGAPPIPAGKLSGLVPSNMPQPDFGEPVADGPDPELAFEAPPRPPPPPMIGGVGSGYAVNQAIARGEVERPVSLANAKKMGAQQPKQGPLSQETVELLKLQQQQGGQQQPTEEQDPRQAEAQARQQKIDASEREITESNKLELDNLPLDLIAQMRTDIIYDVKRRKAVEALLEPLDIADLVTKREITQHVPSVPGRIEYDFRTVNEQEHLFCMQYVYEFPGSARYIEELLSMCKLVCSFVALNGRMLPDHRKGIGTLSEEIVKEQFEKKFKLMTLYPTHLIADVGAQYHWFVERVNKLFDVDSLKNG